MWRSRNGVEFDGGNGRTSRMSSVPNNERKILESTALTEAILKMCFETVDL
jgi:hypothetical protein